jgi:hypothetical protein
MTDQRESSAAPAIMTTADRFLLAALVALTAASYGLAGVLLHPGSEVFVEVDGAVVYKANLTTPSVFPVRGVRGDLRLEIREGAVAVVEADCPNHLCVRMGWRRRSGEMIVCVPNKTIVRIAGERSPGARATTG